MQSRPIIRLRIILREGIALGPGKADLLAAIEQHGSIAAAGRSMNMSYQRAWSLVNELNSSFESALVVVSRGGSTGGGALLTTVGRRVLAAYRTIEGSAARHCGPELDELADLAPTTPA